MKNPYEDVPESQLDLVTEVSIAMIDAHAESLSVFPSWDEALRHIADIRFQLEILEEHHVNRARRDGASWGDVAYAVGLTRQGAWKKHASREV